MNAGPIFLAPGGKAPNNSALAIPTSPAVNVGAIPPPPPPPPPPAPAPIPVKTTLLTKNVSKSDAGRKATHTAGSSSGFLGDISNGNYKLKPLVKKNEGAGEPRPPTGMMAQLQSALDKRKLGLRVGEDSDAEPSDSEWDSDDESSPKTTHAYHNANTPAIKAAEVKASTEAKLLIIKEETSVQSGTTLRHSRGAGKTAVMPVSSSAKAETPAFRTFIPKEEDVVPSSSVQEIAKRFSTPQAAPPISSHSTSSKRSQGETPLTLPSSLPVSKLSCPRPPIAAKPRGKV